MDVVEYITSRSIETVTSNSESKRKLIGEVRIMNNILDFPPMKVR